jgi:hypothetical protein
MSATLAELHDVNEQLVDLMARLRVANEEFAVAARPLTKLPELNSSQQRELARRIRAAEQKREEVTQLIDQVLAKATSLSDHPPDCRIA